MEISSSGLEELKRGVDEAELLESDSARPEDERRGAPDVDDGGLEADSRGPCGDDAGDEPGNITSRTSRPLPNSACTCSAVVGLMRPNLLALGAARGRAAWEMRARATGWLGMRTATVDTPQVTREETAADLGKSRVRGPGQKRRVRLRTRAARGSWESAEKGVSSGSMMRQNPESREAPAAVDASSSSLLIC